LYFFVFNFFKLGSLGDSAVNSAAVNQLLT